MYFLVGLPHRPLRATSSVNEGGNINSTVLVRSFRSGSVAAPGWKTLSWSFALARNLGSLNGGGRALTLYSCPKQEDLMRSIVFLTRALMATGLALTLARADFALAAAAPAWPQAKSDIPVDPAIRFGALPNGMRYAIMKNTTPKGEASMRLRIGAGSLEEGDAQQGLAHFLEHMAFRGSTHVPEGDVFQILQRLGLRVGADANASTGPTQTIYQWDLPKADKPTLDTAFMLARDVVSELSLKPDSFEAERGP